MTTDSALRLNAGAEESKTLTGSTYSRRRLMKMAALGGISLAAAKMLLINPTWAAAASPDATGLPGGPTDGSTQFAAIPGNSIDEKVLNFALTLEILESDLYRQALNLASGLDKDYALNVNPRVYQQKVGGGGLSEGASAAAYLYLKQFTYVEGAHREFLIGAIKAAGLTPAPKNPGGYVFAGGPPAADMKSILTKILPLEETGVRAYLGALPYLTDLGLATVAGSIYSTECRHSAAVEYTLGIDPGPKKLPGDLTVVPNPPAANTFEYYLKPSTVVAAVQPMFVK